MSISSSVSKSVFCSALCIGFFVFVGIAQANDPEWYSELRLQLNDSQKCMAEEVTDANQSGEGDTKTQQATVLCEDGRTIKASRSGTNAQFSFKMM